MCGAVSQVTCVFDHDAGFLTMTITFDKSKISRFPAKHRANNCFNRSGFVHCVFVAELRPTAFILKKCYDTEAKPCFATHDEDIISICVYILFHRMRIYSTVQLCSITSLWHSGQHLCRAIGRLQVRISQGFWLLSKRRSL